MRASLACLQLLSRVEAHQPLKVLLKNVGNSRLLRCHISQTFFGLVVFVRGAKSPAPWKHDVPAGAFLARYAPLDAAFLAGALFAATFFEATLFAGAFFAVAMLVPHLA